MFFSIYLFLYFLAHQPVIGNDRKCVNISVNNVDICVCRDCSKHFFQPFLSTDGGSRANPNAFSCQQLRYPIMYALFSTVKMFVTDFKTKFNTCALFRYNFVMLYSIKNKVNYPTIDISHGTYWMPTRYS